MIANIEEKVKERIQWKDLEWLLLESLKEQKEREWAEAIFDDKLAEVLPKVRKTMFLRNPIISSKINKYLPRLKTKDKVEIWKTIKEKIKPIVIYQDKKTLFINSS